MKHCVLCWEYGRGLGHLVAVKTIAKALRLRFDWRLTLAHPDHVETGPVPEFDDVVKFPAAYQLSRYHNRGKHIGSYLNTIDAMGFHDTKVVFTRLKLWQNLLESLNPDLLIADYAPNALMAARGKYPTIAVGNGFTMPASNIDTYPVFFSVPPPIDPVPLLESIQQATLLAGCHPVEHVPHIFKADVNAACSLDFADPFSSVRIPAARSAIFPQIVPHLNGLEGSEIFAYLTECLPEVHERVLQALVQSGHPVVAYSFQASSADFVAMRGTNVTLLEERLPFQEILQRARLVVHLGGHFLGNEMAMAGIPQVILGNDVEKFIHGGLFVRRGLAKFRSSETAQSPEELSDIIKLAFEDIELLEATQSFAASQSDDVQTSGVDSIVDDAERLIGHWIPRWVSSRSLFTT